MGTNMAARASEKDWIKRGAERGHFGEKRALAAQAIAEAFMRADGGNRERLLDLVTGEVQDYLTAVVGWNDADARKMVFDIRKSLTPIK